MSVATLSFEARIASKMRELDVTAQQLCRIGRRRQISISDAKMSQALTNKKPLDAITAHELVELLDDMAEVKRGLVSKLGPVAPPINWNDDVLIADMVLIETVRRLDQELQMKGFL